MRQASHSSEYIQRQATWNPGSREAAGRKISKRAGRQSRQAYKAGREEVRGSTHPGSVQVCGRELRARQQEIKLRYMRQRN